MTTDPQTRPPDPPPSSGVLRFALTAGAWCIGLFGLMRLGWVERQILLPFAQLQERVADQLTGVQTDAVYVDASCSGGDAMALCLGAVLAFPATWSARLRGAGVGLLVIAAFNIVRIGNLSLLGDNLPLLDLLHVYIWPAILIVVAVAYVYAWMRRQMGPAASGAGPDPGVAWQGPARRFLLLTVVGTVAYFAAAGWVYESALLHTLGVWVAMTGAGILATLGVSATASGNIVTTTHGAFIVTQECIATPLIPVYVAGALAVPFARWQRVAALGAAPAIFFLLGVARLLVLALPTTLIASHTVAIHAFSQVLVAGLLVAGLAMLSARSVGRQNPARRAVGAIGVGIVAALAAGPSGATSCTGRWTGGSCSSSTAAIGWSTIRKGRLRSSRHSSSACAPRSGWPSAHVGPGGAWSSGSWGWRGCSSPSCWRSASCRTIWGSPPT